MLCACLLGAAHAPAPGRLIALEVGEGQSLLLARGDRGLLIDTARVRMDRHVLERLAQHGVTRLDAAVWMHMDPDHVGYWFRIQKAVPDLPVPRAANASTVWPGPIPRAGSPTPWTRCRRAVIGSCAAGASGPGKASRSSAPAGRSREQRAQSPVRGPLHVRVGDADGLLLGDVARQVQRTLLQRGDIPADVDVLVVGHHGSKHTTSPALLERTAPGYAVVSADADNIRGYPAEATIDRLRRHADALLRTWVDGEICLELATDGTRRRCPGDG